MRKPGIRYPSPHERGAGRFRASAPRRRKGLRCQVSGKKAESGGRPYGVNYMLVREGAFNTLGWDELKSAHSHNEQDRYFSEMKAVFYPKDGKGPGCASPFEFCARLRDGMKGMPGGLEVLWLLANFDWGA